MAHLSDAKTLKQFGVEEKSSKEAISSDRTLTNSHSSTMNQILAEQGLIMYASLFSDRMS